MCRRCSEDRLKRDVVGPDGNIITVNTQSCEYVTAANYIIYRNTYQEMINSGAYNAIGLTTQYIQSNITLLDSAIPDKETNPSSCNYMGYLSSWTVDRRAYIDYITNN